MLFKVLIIYNICWRWTCCSRTKRSPKTSLNKPACLSTRSVKLATNKPKNKSSHARCPWSNSKSPNLYSHNNTLISWSNLFTLKQWAMIPPSHTSYPSTYAKPKIPTSKKWLTYWRHCLSNQETNFVC